MILGELIDEREDRLDTLLDDEGRWEEGFQSGSMFSRLKASGRSACCDTITVQCAH
jgi:hypothetical protein